MSTLRELAAEEDAIWDAIDAVRAATASPVLRDARLARERVYGRAEGIFTEYVAIARASRREAQRREAARRAVFLSWWAAAAPPTTTGFAELPASDVGDVLEMATGFALATVPDVELTWMLPWYYWQVPGWLTQHRAGAALERYCRGRPMDLWAEQSVRPRGLRRRGTMGRYWLVILARAA